MLDWTGREIGRYHLLEKLGEGGMAIVYYPRTWLYELKYRGRNYALIAFAALIFIVSLALKNYYGIG